MFLLVPAHPGFPGQIPQSLKTVVCVCLSLSLAPVNPDGFYLSGASSPG